MDNDTRTGMECVLHDIRGERWAQYDKWGGPSHDDKHGSHDWIAYIIRHAGRAVMWPFDPDLFRKQMIRVAALAVAAVEWIDRNHSDLVSIAGQEESRATLKGIILQQREREKINAVAIRLMSEEIAHSSSRQVSEESNIPYDVRQEFLDKAAMEVSYDNREPD